MPTVSIVFLGILPFFFHQNTRNWRESVFSSLLNMHQNKSLLRRTAATTTTTIRENKTNPVDSSDELRRSVISRPEKRLRKYTNSSSNDDEGGLLSQVATLLSNQQVRASSSSDGGGFGDLEDLNIFLHTLKQERDEQDVYCSSLNSYRSSTSSEE